MCLKPFWSGDRAQGWGGVEEGMLCLGSTSKFAWRKNQAEAKSFHDVCVIILQLKKKKIMGENVESKNSSSQPTRGAVNPGQLRGYTETGGP